MLSTAWRLAPAGHGSPETRNPSRSVGPVDFLLCLAIGSPILGCSSCLLRVAKVPIVKGGCRGAGSRVGLVCSNSHLRTIFGTVCMGMQAVWEKWGRPCPCYALLAPHSSKRARAGYIMQWSARVKNVFHACSAQQPPQWVAEAVGASWYRCLEKLAAAVVFLSRAVSIKASVAQQRGPCRSRNHPPLPPSAAASWGRCRRRQAAAGHSLRSAQL